MKHGTGSVQELSVDSVDMHQDQENMAMNNQDHHESPFMNPHSTQLKDAKDTSDGADSVLAMAQRRPGAKKDTLTGRLSKGVITINVFCKLHCVIEGTMEALDHPC
jgi:hypothetical protein